MNSIVLSVIASGSALIAVVVAIWQINKNTKWNQLDRTYKHSPSRTPVFLEAIEKLQSGFPEFSITNQELIDQLKRERVEFLKRKHTDFSIANASIIKEFEDTIPIRKVTIPIPKSKIKDVVIVANLWGQMASEYKTGLLHKKKAKELLRTNFVKFCYTFEDWLSSSDRYGIYKQTLEVYSEWKGDILKEIKFHAK